LRFWFLRLVCLSAGSALLLAALAPSVARAQSCMTLQYEFQPDCYRPDESSDCVQSASRMDLGPQIAVWLQDGSGKFVDTLLVTNATARRGIGNRPGRWDFLSGPLFPYGKRVMSLPIWAHARGKTYSTLMMQEAICAVGGAGYPGESCLGWHEGYSSQELYYCRPLQEMEAQAAIGTTVDAITCPTKFNSEKGKFDPSTPSYYPPRSDLTSFGSNDGADPPTFAAINDLDAVAAATPAYGAPYNGTWAVPGDLPPGDYALLVEVNKEFDTNAAHDHPDFVDDNLSTYGTEHNFGQPSVVYKVPLHIDVTMPTTDAAAVSEIAGYGDWTGATGALNPRDASISTGVPGSGEGRLLTTSANGLSGRVIASVAPCLIVCPPVPAPPSAVTNLGVATGGLGATSVILQFDNAAPNEAPVTRYDVRYLPGPSLTDAQLGSAIPASSVSSGSPGTPASVKIMSLKPDTQYTVAVTAFDQCSKSSPTVTFTFTTPTMKFTQLSGCFVATAAWGSAMAPDVAAMRKVRDRLRPASTMFAVATDLYYRSGPAAAEVLRRSDTARALVRRLLGPVGAASQAAVALAPRQ
jgi:Fibronectin type III domain